mmetsp:Transcript_43875/g.133630  ORF Transcript_43875/g.133630 Transcript_43875/m.133630 type:complete len:95 (+) Transcript_43875:1277-1561(+)|eukprot:CAMPEP_0113540250 /NCGR_PEP_ID=MMETSP0015_2-20120614/8375_1 /TAXON_ID=2838 /ORGANISM="Odontella" /LENGTH=94 /DNA_ID=CAMNT_0000440031 /DNA_START=1120 /DNA_END=1404 /DNA_ORIENTATION=- /assembly_acc=CAM_ASM_000160
MVDLDDEDEELVVQPTGDLQQIAVTGEKDVMTEAVTYLATKGEDLVKTIHLLTERATDSERINKEVRKAAEELSDDEPDKARKSHLEEASGKMK